MSIAPTDAVLVLDIGGTKVAAAIMTPDGALLLRSEIPTHAGAGPLQTLERIAEFGRQTIDRFHSGRPHGLAVAAAGIATAGQIDEATGALAFATDNMPGWTGLPLGARLTEHWQIPVFVDNDVNCHALAEVTVGAGRGFRNLLLVAVGTGIGGGVVVDGRVLRGRLGGAGEIGQICVEPGGRPCSEETRGCLEAYAASSTIVARSGLATIQEVAAAYTAGQAMPAVDEAAAWLGRGLSTAAYLLAPEIILVGGSVGLLGPRYLDAVRAEFRRVTLPSHRATPVEPALLGADSGLVGAGILAGVQTFTAISRDQRLS